MAAINTTLQHDVSPQGTGTPELSSYANPPPLPPAGEGWGEGALQGDSPSSVQASSPQLSPHTTTRPMSATACPPTDRRYPAQEHAPPRFRLY